jgi:hypothetical protein
MFPDGKGGVFYLSYYYQSQTINWSGAGASSSLNNADQSLNTLFLTAGVQYMFNRSWGVQAEVPYVSRGFATDTSFGTPPPNIVGYQWDGIGDIRLKGIYAGFSDDLSTGVTFGVKLPTGYWSFHPDVVDRDTQIGSGSTDILLGAFHRGALDDEANWGWFANIQFQLPVAFQDNYYPGAEADLAIGAHYKGWDLGNNLHITPIVQVLGQVRATDTGTNAANPPASGFQRVMLSPGIEFDVDKMTFYMDVAVPVYQNIVGNQLTAPVLFKVLMAYRF